MNNIEAMKQALEALEHIDYEDNDRDFLFPYQCTMLDNAITALRTAIEQAAVPEAHKKQEPVAWKHDCAALLQNGVELWVDQCPHCGKPRTPPAAPVQEPSYSDVQLVEQIMSDCGCSTNNERLLERITARLAKHKTPAPQRQWVSLADAEKMHLIKHNPYKSAMDLLNTHEAKLREKNGGRHESQ